MKIDSCLIVKNEENNIGKLIKQLLKFSHEIHITDTGSTDNTINIIKKLQNTNSNLFLHHFEWCKNFSKARNYSLTCYNCKADYQFWCDADDELNEKLMETILKLKDSDNLKYDIFHIRYKYSNDDIIYHWRTSILKVERNFEWKDAIHEFIDYQDYRYDNPKLNWDYFDNGSLLIHHSNPNNDHLERNIDIFRNMELNGEEFSSRNRCFYGRELASKGYKEQAIYQLHKCIDFPDNNYVDKVNSCIFLLALEDNEAIDYFFKLMKNGFIRKDLLYYIGSYYYNKQDFEIARMYYSACINFSEPNNALLFNYDPKCHINALECLGAIENNNFSNPMKALDYFNQILRIDPNNVRIKEHINKIQNTIKQILKKE